MYIPENIFYEISNNMQKIHACFKSKTSRKQMKARFKNNSPDHSLVIRSEKYQNQNTYLYIIPINSTLYGKWNKQKITEE